MQVTPALLMAHEHNIKMQSHSVQASVMLEHLEQRRIASTQARKLQGRLQEAYKRVLEQKQYP